MEKYTKLQKDRCDVFYHYNEDMRLLIKTKKLLAEAFSTRVSPLTQGENGQLVFKLWNKELTKRNFVGVRIIIESADDLFNLGSYNWIDKAAGIETKKQSIPIVMLARIRIIRMVYEALALVNKDIITGKQRKGTGQEVVVHIDNDGLHIYE